MMLYQFAPNEGLTVEQLAQVFVELQVRVDEGTFLGFTDLVKEQFRQLSKDELDELAKQRKAQIEAMQLAAEANRRGRIVVPKDEDGRIIVDAR